MEEQWNVLEPSEIVVYSSPEIVGLQRAFVEFLGADQEQRHPLRYLRERYLFLGGKFVMSAGKGLFHQFPQSPIPNSETDVIDWLLEQAQLGADSVEKIWKRYTEPEQ